MNIEIELTKERVLIRLKNGRKTLFAEDFLLDKRLGEVLLIKIDEVIRKSGKRLAEIRKFQVKSELCETYTSLRIVKTVVKTLNWSLKNS